VIIAVFKCSLGKSLLETSLSSSPAQLKKRKIMKNEALIKIPKLQRQIACNPKKVTLKMHGNKNPI